MLRLDRPEIKTAVMLCGHGSRSQSAVDEFKNMAEKLKAMLHPIPVEYGYLEFATPLIRDGLDALRARGVQRVLAVPVMLMAAGHAKNDIPSVLNLYASQNGIEIHYGRELALDLRMLSAARARIEQAVSEANQQYGTLPLQESCLVVIGRGASDPDANSNISKVARMLWEGMGFGWCETGYSGVTFPLVAPCLEHVAKLGYKRVYVFPYFLFSGILVDRIYGFTDKIAQTHDEMEFIKVGYLNDHDDVMATMIDRIQEIIDGKNHMNCSLCKYRAQFIGFEDEVGARQESHHHHVEGQGANAPGSNVADCVHCDDFCTGVCKLVEEDAHHHHHHEHDHSHDHHHHAPYPHAEHPLGPQSSLRYRKS